MEVEAALAPFVVYKDCVGCNWVFTSVKFNQSLLKRQILTILDEKGWILKNLD